MVLVPTGLFKCDVTCGGLESEAVAGELPTPMRSLVSANPLVSVILLIISVCSIEAVPMFDEGVDEDVIMSTLC